MGKASKATKKFQSTKLDGVLKRRKEHKKVQQQFKARRPKRPSKPDDADDDAAPAAPKKATNDDIFDSMDVDEFMAGGFEQANDDEDDEKSASGEEPEGSVDATNHKDQLNDLSKTDPEFYKYLKENDAALLDFDNEEDLVFSDADEEEGKQSSNTIDVAMVEEWTMKLKANNFGAFRRIVVGFKAAAYLNEDETKEFKYKIDDPEAFQKLVNLAVVEIPKFLDRYVPLKRTNAGKIKLPTSDKKFLKLLPLLKSHFTSLLHFLEELTEPAMQKRILDSSVPLIGYMSPFKVLLKKFVKGVLEVWSTNPSDSTRISAFVLIREYFLAGDATLRESTLKQLYSAFVKEARNINSHTLPLINLMKNSASELFSIDQTMSYQLIFGFLRQLAIVLRKATNEKTKDSSKTVYNWQFVNSLDFWSLTLSQYAADPTSQLRPLIYPFVQVTLGVIKLVPTAQFFPLRFHLIKALNRLASKTNTYIPIAPLIFEVFEASDMKKRPNPSTAKPMEFDHAIRAKPEYLKGKVYQDQVGEIAIELLLDFYAINSTSIAFPELALPATIYMKRYTKKTKNAKLGRAMSAVIERLTANSKYIEQLREKVSFDPKNIRALETFGSDLEIDKTPLGGYVKTQRKMMEEQRRLIREANEQNDSRPKKEESDSDAELELESESENSIA